jgi:hypothetical protein
MGLRWVLEHDHDGDGENKFQSVCKWAMDKEKKEKRNCL